jgi:hypothetical protein
MNTYEATQQVIERAKNSKLKLFEVKRAVGPNWLPGGIVPFDVRATKGIATFSVYAEYEELAELQVDNFLDID